MKKLLFAAIAIASISMLATSSGFAEPTHPNEVGLYMAPNGYGATGTNEIGVPVTVYLVLTKPTDVEDGDVPFQTVTGFELQLHFNPVPNNDLFVLDYVLPNEHVDIGRYKDINEGILEFIVGISGGSEINVIDEAAVLIEFTFMNLGPEQTAVTLSPIPDGPNPSIMAFLGEEYSQLRAMYSVGGSHEAPVFIFNGEAVAVETKTFGSVKALYR